MKVVKQTADYTIVQRRDSRYAVRGQDKKWINGDAKVEILVKEGLLTKPAAKTESQPAAEEPADAGSGEDAGADSQAES